MARRFGRWAAPLAALLVAACGGGSPDAPAGSGSTTASAQSAQGTLRLQRLEIAERAKLSRLDPRLVGARGTVAVWVSLDENSLAAQRATLAEAAGIAPSDRKVALREGGALRQAMSAHRDRLRGQQSSVAAQLGALGGRELARLERSHNAIAVRIDASQLKNVVALSGVAKVRPVVHYTLDLSETVPYVGGGAVQARGVDGTGVTVAVLDSGIDYTHRNLGGAGTTEAYAAAWGTSTTDPKNTTRDGLFPTAKVVDGFDFVGETWGIDANNDEVGERTEDPDPIDADGHGTHVADIIAGRSADGTHKGMAPGAKLVAVKVCSAISSACNGVALLKGMEFALDPNGDGNLDDAVDVINMSLGSNYGQIEDDLTLAAANAVKAGVVVVTSAGNGANKPYIVGSPSIAQGVISVAQTQVPSAVAIPLVVNSPATIAGVYGNTATVEWAPVGAGVGGDVVYVGRGCPDSADPLDAYLASPAGKIALVDRGACNISTKIDRAAKAGATGVLLGLVAAGDAVSFSFGGGDTFVPTLVIQQSLSTAIKNSLKAGAVNVSFSPAAGIPLVGSMASTSSRGPSIPYQSIKPEIGAPGASVSAEVGTGAGETAFGGTSGAAPMVSGAVALLLQAHPQRSPVQIKAMLMNSAETVVYTNPALSKGELAPITRIGAGELRVDRAIGVETIAWNRETLSSALSFGAVEVSSPMTIERTLRIDNLSRRDKRFTVTPSFRFADDEASGAVRVVVKPSVRVGGGDREELEVKLVIDPTKLPAWTLNGGLNGGNGALLNAHEFDGYLTLTSGSEKITVPWHVLPRKAADADAVLGSTRNGPVVKVRNRGLADSDWDAFSLLGTSGRIPRADLPKPGDNFAAIDLRAVGVRFSEADDTLEFAISTWGRRAHPNYPAEYDVFIDVNNDGTPDFLVFNAEQGSGTTSATGRNLTFVFDLATFDGGAFYFTDADLNSGNAILTIPFSVLGVAPGTTLGISVDGWDNYFQGQVTDTIANMRYTPGNPRYGVVGDAFGTVPARTAATLGITASTLPDAVSSESGLLMMFRRNAGTEAEILRLR